MFDKCPDTCLSCLTTYFLLLQTWIGIHQNFSRWMGSESQVKMKSFLAIFEDDFWKQNVWLPVTCFVHNNMANNESLNLIWSKANIKFENQTKHQLTIIFQLSQSDCWKKSLWVLSWYFMQHLQHFQVSKLVFKRRKSKQFL